MKLMQLLALFLLLWADAQLAKAMANTKLTLTAPSDFDEAENETPWLNVLDSPHDSDFVDETDEDIKPLSLDLAVPNSVKKEEILNVTVSVINKLSRNIPVILTFGKFTGGELKGNQTFSVCLRKREKAVHDFRLKARVIGNHNISVISSYDFSSSNCSNDKPIRVKDEVVEQVLVTPRGTPVEKTNSLFFCFTEKRSGDDTWKLELPENAVPGSGRAVVTVIGDVLAPSKQHLIDLVREKRPKYIDNLVPSIAVLKYLKTAVADYPELHEKALKNLRKLYKERLQYRHEDGSYSANKQQKSGSIMLTTAVVKALAQASEFIDVDRNDLRESIDWILSHQTDDGCFRQTEADSKRNLGPTSYILIALLQSDVVQDDAVFENAVDCLRQAQGDNDQMLVHALSTYALQLVNERLGRVEPVNSDAEEALHDWVQNATRAGQVEIFWQKDPSDVELNVRITAYAILALVKSGDDENINLAFKASRWIARQRNRAGQFNLTRATVIALEALTAFTSTLPRKDVDLRIIASPEDQERFEFAVTNSNKQVLQQGELKTVPRYLQWIARGVGCSLLQSTVWYTVEERVNAFDVSARVSQDRDDKCNNLRLEFSLSYQQPGDRPSKTAVLEVGILDGYKPIIESHILKKKLPNFKEWYFEDGKVFLTFDSIDSTPSNVSFNITQKKEVASVGPAQVKLYSQQAPKSFAQDEYGLEGLDCSS